MTSGAARISFAVGGARSMNWGWVLGTAQHSSRKAKREHPVSEVSLLCVPFRGKLNLFLQQIKLSL